MFFTEGIQRTAATDECIIYLYTKTLDQLDIHVPEDDRWMSSHTLLFRAFIIVGLEWSKRIEYMDRALELGFLLGSDNASSCWASFMFSPWNSDEIVHQFMATEILPYGACAER
jgi:hypothetical protein